MCVDGFVAAARKDRLDDYRQLASTVWKEHGVLSYVENVADDVQLGKLTSFPRAVLLQEGEVVVFLWITYPSREVCDACNQKVMADSRMCDMKLEDMPFDGGRMFWGGFKPLFIA